MGMGHRVCQDYARAGRTPQENPLVYGIVSDGCSSSSDTDVGARLLALTAEHMLRNSYQKAWSDRVFGDVSLVALRVREGKNWMPADLPNEALDATLLFVATDQPNRVRFACMGDGVIATKDWDGELRIWDVEAPDGYPRYPNYVNNEARRRSVEGGEPWVVHFPGGGEFRTSKVKSFDQTVVGAQVVAIFSDGVRSFTDAERRPIPGAEIVAELMAFKNYQGAFVQRRLHAFLKAAAKRGWRHEDDLAMAAIDMAAEGA
jgi:hypothetical protein